MANPSIPVLVAKIKRLEKENARLREWVELSKVVERHEDKMEKAKIYFTLLRKPTTTEELDAAEKNLTLAAAPFSDDPAAMALFRLEYMFKEAELKKLEGTNVTAKNLPPSDASLGTGEPNQ